MDVNRDKKIAEPETRFLFLGTWPKRFLTHLLVNSSFKNDQKTKDFFCHVKKFHVLSNVIQIHKPMTQSAYLMVMPRCLDDEEKIIFADFQVHFQLNPITLIFNLVSREIFKPKYKIIYEENWNFVITSYHHVAEVVT